MKGVFGEGTSVVAVPPKPPAPAGGPDAVANLFASDTRVAAPPLSAEVGNDNEAELRKRAAQKNRGLWSDEPVVPRPAPPRPPGLPAAVTGKAGTGPWNAGVMGASVAAPANRNSLDAPAPAARARPQPLPEAPGRPSHDRLLSGAPTMETPIVGSTRSVKFEEAADKLELQVAASANPVGGGLDDGAPHPALRASGEVVAARKASQVEAIEDSDPEERKRDKARASRPLIAPVPAKKKLSPLRLMLIACVLLIAAAVALLLGAYAGLWRLPPSAAAMFGFEQNRRHERKLHPPTSALGPQQTAADGMSPTHDPVATRPAAFALPSAAPPDLLAAPAGMLGAPAPSVLGTPAPNMLAAPAIPQAPDPGSNAMPGMPPTGALGAPAASAPEAARPPQPSAAVPVVTSGDEAAAREPPTGSPATLASAAKLDASTPNVLPPPATGSEVPETERLSALARGRLQSGDAAGAEALLRRALAFAPDDHHLIASLVPILLAQGRKDEALRSVEQIVRKRPRRVAYRLLEGDVKRAAGDDAGAEAAFREALALDPVNRKARRELGLAP